MKALCFFLMVCCYSVQAETVHVWSSQPSPYVVGGPRRQKIDTSHHGHGVFISAHRILAVAHVITGDDHVYFEREVDGKLVAYKCRVLKRDKENDLVLLETEETAKTIAPVAKALPASTITLRTKTAQVEDWTVMVRVKDSKDFSVNDENSPSGCPLFNTEGELCGIVTAVMKEKEDGPIKGVECAGAALINCFLKETK